MTCPSYNNEKFVSLVPKYPSDDRYEKMPFPETEYQIPVGRPTRIYCDGIFDLFHVGHSRLLEQVKGFFPEVEVIVGVCNDELTVKYKGNVVLTDSERYESVRQNKYVSEVIESAPWTIDMEFLEKHNIDFVAHDDAPYSCGDTLDVYSFAKKINRFIPTKRAQKISTTSIITRIIKNHGMYLRRQLLRGIPYKDLNVSIFTKKRIEIEDMLEMDVKDMKEELRFVVAYWEDISKRWINKLKMHFNKPNGFVRKLFNVKNSRGKI